MHIAAALPTDRFVGKPEVDFSRDRGSPHHDSCCEIPIPPASVDRRARGNSKAERGRPPGGADAVQPAPGSFIHRALDARALHNMSEAAGSV